jgi:hypothetical protein
MYTTNALVLTLQPIDLNDNAGRLCYKNIVTSGVISANSELSGFPITNAANPATWAGWEAEDTATQTITITNSTRGNIDYIGIARHNLSQAGLTVQVKFDGVQVLAPSAVSDTQALLFLFEQATPETIEIVIAGASNPAKLAVIYVGESTLLERNIYVGHTPITYGRDRNVINGISQSGEWVGEVTLNETLSTSVNLQNLTPTWYRETLDPFFKQNPRNPCFWAWRPGGYPAEISYCWVEGNPRPVNQRSNGMMSIDWNFRGIA